MLTAARLPLQSRKLWAAPLLLGFAGRLPDRASFGCALGDSYEFIAPATMSQHDHRQRNRSLRAAAILAVAASDLIVQVWQLF